MPPGNLASPRPYIEDQDEDRNQRRGEAANISMDRNLNNLLKWSIENSSSNNSTVNGSSDNTPPANPASAPSNLTPELMSALFGGPSDAELMKAAMAVVTSTDDPSITLEDRLTAFDNFEQLIESLDNANNMEPLALWTPLLSMLAPEHDDELRRMAAWCVGTAVQNNAASQERLLAMGGIPPLVAIATNADEKEAVRRKAVYALSSAVRNYQPAMDVAVEELAKKGGDGTKVDAMNMVAVDDVMTELRTMAADRKAHS